MVGCGKKGCCSGTKGWSTAERRQQGMRPPAHSTPRSTRAALVGSRGQSMQLVPSTPTNLRSGQLMHWPVPAGSLILPSSEHVADTAEPLHCFPAGHARGSTKSPAPPLLLAASSQTYPSGHDSQKGLPISRWNLPDGQSWHSSVVSLPKRPALHGMHASAVALMK